MTQVLENPTSRLASRVINGLLSIKPLANFARNRARQMMIQRSESIGVDWIGQVAALRSRNWDADLTAVRNPDLQYPDYYLRTFHAYDDGNLGWEPATEVEVAALAVHSGIWPERDAQGDTRLRQSYHDILKATLPTPPQTILDLGCSIGMSTDALQAIYPEAQITGIDLSPYFLAVAHYRAQQQDTGVSPAKRWLHAAAESTGLPDASFDLVSASLLFHELPQTAAIAILREARRLLRPDGHLAIMDMNPQSQVYAKMPPYILTLLKSTEPYLDEYFQLDVTQEFIQAGFQAPTITCNTHRHRAIVAQVK
ncbi:MAG: class I SAM-dependent methyltransferase [Leptolyngbyaceae cyanobacterium bins.59]|nr:class I SAM-dependent methyltransferase [Leptolyngbyaceae cyanobacterium bins.59]